MQDLVQMVAQKAGIAPDQAHTAVSTVMEFLKTRLPEPLRGQIDHAVAGGTPGGFGDMAKGLGGMFDR